MSSYLSRFLSQTNALFIKHIKCYNVQLKYLFAPTCFGPIGPSSGSVCWALQKVQYCVIDQWRYIVIWYAALWQQVFQAVYCVPFLILVHSTHIYLPMKMEQSVPKRRHINSRRRVITQKKAHNKQFAWIRYLLAKHSSEQAISTTVEAE